MLKVCDLLLKSVFIFFVSVDDDSTGDSWELRRRQRHELVEPLREEVKQAMEKLHKELKEGNSLVLHRALVCPMVLLKAVDTFGYYSK